MSELYESLLNRYQNSQRFIDDDELMGIILFNEPLKTIRRMLVEHKLSHPEKKFKLIEFVIDALEKGYDWKLYGKPEWEEIEPEKKKKFMKPKKR